MGKELPKSWIAGQISDLADVTSGIGFPKEFQGQSSGSIPFYKVGDISRLVKSGEKYLENADHYIDDKTRVKLKGKIFSEGTIVFAKIGEALRLNRRAIITKPSLVDNNVMGVVPLLNETSMFLYYFLCTQDLGLFSAGNAVPSVRKSSVLEINLPIPPLPEQKRIVAKLDTLFGHLDVLKTKLDRIPELLKNFRQQVLTQAVTGKLTEEWREGEGLYENHDGPFAIPETWGFKELSDLSHSLKYGSSSKSLNDGHVPVLRMGNLQSGEIDWADLKYSVDEAEITKYLLKEGDVLFNRTNSPELVGKTSIFRGEQKAIYAGYLIKVETTEALNSEYLNYLLNSHYARKWCWEVKTDGVSQSNINAKKLGAFLIPHPSTEEQFKIVTKVKELFQVADRIESQYQSLKAKIDNLPRAILNKAFKGELVPQDPNDEPASVLLERIRKEKQGKSEISQKPSMVKAKSKPKKIKAIDKSSDKLSEDKEIIRNKIISQTIFDVVDSNPVEAHLFRFFGNKKFTVEDIPEVLKNEYERLRILIYKALENTAGIEGSKLTLERSSNQIYFRYVKI